MKITEKQLTNIIQSILKESYGRRGGTICLDFDGTVVTHEYPYVGKDIGAVPVLKKLVENGNRLILYTMRSHRPVRTPFGVIDTLQQAIDWFKENGIPLYGVNTNPGQEEWTDSPKAHGDLTIDDRNTGCPLKDGHVDWDAVENWLIDNGYIEEDEEIMLSDKRYYYMAKQRISQQFDELIKQGVEPYDIKLVVTNENNEEND